MVGRFTTDPNQAQFYIPEILDYIPNPFPLSARLYMDADSEYPLPDVLTKRPIKLLNSTVEESIIGNLRAESMDPSDSSSNKDLIELPVVSDIMVSVIPEDQIQLNTITKLYSDTQTLWKNLVTLPDDSPTFSRVPVSGKNPIQHKLSTLSRKGEEKKASAIEAPPLVRKDLPLISSSPDQNAYQVLIDGMGPSNPYTPLRSLSSSNSSNGTNRSSSTTDDTEGMYEDACTGEQEGESFDKVSNLASLTVGRWILCYVIQCCC